MAKNTEIADLIEKIEDLTGETVEVTGGGKGWKARVEDAHGDNINAKGTTKVEALTALLVIAESGEGDEGFEPTDEAEAEEEIEGCADECQSSTSDFCQCACQGQNHGIAVDRTGGVVVIGEKLCKCGCGETTKRTFVPGHDARYHGLVALRKWGAENGIAGTDEEVRKAKVAAQRKAARERRAAKRAATAKAAEALAKSLAPKPAKSRKIEKSRGGIGVVDDLPF